jgi:hypothetical protein
MSGLSSAPIKVKAEAAPSFLPDVSCGLFGLNCCVQAAESSGHQDPPPSDASLSIVSRSRTPPKYFAKAYSKTDGAFGTDENNVMHE